MGKKGKKDVKSINQVRSALKRTIESDWSGFLMCC